MAATWGTGRRTAHGVCLLRETSAAARGDRPGAGIIGTFGLTVKLGSATFEFLFSKLPQSTNIMVELRKGGDARLSSGRRLSTPL